MNILIVGEFSAFSKELKKGFVLNGHKCMIISSGDSFKKIEHDDDDIRVDISNYKLCNFDLRYTSVIKNILNKRLILNKLLEFKELNGVFDILIVVHSCFISEKFYNAFLSIDEYNAFLNVSSLKILIGCGTDIPFLLEHNQTMRYSPFMNGIHNSFKHLLSSGHKSHLHKLYNYFDVHVPTAFEYSSTFNVYSSGEEFKIISEDIIRLPLYVSDIYRPNIVRDKVRILHGSSRDYFKGSKIIKDALFKLQNDYPDKVELLLPDQLSLSEYLVLLQSSNIVIDQCYSYSYAMNALFAMSYSKIVFSGAEPEALTSCGVSVDTCPVVNIRPDADDIYDKLLVFINDYDLITSHSKLSYDFIVEFHSPKIIADSYIQLYNKYKLES